MFIIDNGNEKALASSIGGSIAMNELPRRVDVTITSNKVSLDTGR